MRVLLVPPIHKYATGEYPSFLSLSDFPSGFAYLASSLKQAGHEVIGGNFNNIPGYVDAHTMLKDKLTKKIQECQPELIGLGGLCTDFKFLKDAIEIIRGIDPKIPIVLGGQIVKNDAEDIYNILKPDYAVKGEGEKLILSVIEDIEDGKSNTRIYNTTANSSIDELGFPDYTPFGIEDMMDNYSGATRLLYRYTRENPRVYGIVTARNCPFSCSFCTPHGEYKERSIPNIMAEIKEAHEKYHFNILLILDELFAVNKDRMNAFSQAVIDSGLDFDWCFQTHASAKLDLPTLQLAKKAGCFSFSYGLESASPTVLASMNKKIKPEQVVEAMELAKQAKIGFSANIIFGDPAETSDTIAESLSWWLANARQSFIFLSNVSPYPGSALFEACRKRGLYPDKKVYYENIDKVPVNLTQIPLREYESLMQLSKFLEQQWLFVKQTRVLKIEQLPDDDKYIQNAGWFYYRITTKCPYCGEEIHYRERLGDPKAAWWLGTGCCKCNSKIKIVS